MAESSSGTLADPSAIARWFRLDDDWLDAVRQRTVPPKSDESMQIRARLEPGTVSDVQGSGMQSVVAEAAGVPVPTSYIRIDGERFSVELDEGFVFIRHPHWSLLGYGETFGDAERGLRDEAAAVSRLLRTMPVSSLDPEAVRLRDFLLRFAGS